MLLKIVLFETFTLLQVLLRLKKSLNATLGQDVLLYTLIDRDYAVATLKDAITCPFVNNCPTNMLAVHVT
jgi:hypothetical protein